MQVTEIYMKKNYVPIILGVVCLFTLALSFFWLYGSRVFISRATGSGIFSSQNSYLFQSPLSAQADGIEEITIYGFLLDDKGLGVNGKKTDLVGADELIIKSASAVSDTTGKVIYRISSTKKGIFKVQISVDGSVLPQEANVTFN